MVHQLAWFLPLRVILCLFCFLIKDVWNTVACIGSCKFGQWAMQLKSTSWSWQGARETVPSQVLRSHFENHRCSLLNVLEFDLCPVNVLQDCCNLHCHHGFSHKYPHSRVVTAAAAAAASLFPPVNTQTRTYTNLFCLTVIIGTVFSPSGCVCCRGWFMSALWCVICWCYLWLVQVLTTFKTDDKAKKTTTYCIEHVSLLFQLLFFLQFLKLLNSINKLLISAWMFFVFYYMNVFIEFCFFFVNIYIKSI